MKTDDSKSQIDFQVLWPPKTLEGNVTASTQPTAMIITVPALSDFKSQILDSGLAIRLAKAGAQLFALVGPDAEQAHDALDWILEADGYENVLTSWHGPNATGDAADFTVATCHTSGLYRLWAVLDQSTDDGKRLKQRLYSAIGSVDFPALSHVR